jgi:hypothetical protein
MRPPRTVSNCAVCVTGLQPQLALIALVRGITCQAIMCCGKGKGQAALHAYTRDEARGVLDRARKKMRGRRCGAVTRLPAVFSGVFSGFDSPKPAYQMVNLSFLVVFLAWAGIIPNYSCQNTSTKQGLMGI